MKDNKYGAKKEKNMKLRIVYKQKKVLQSSINYLK